MATFVVTPIVGMPRDPSATKKKQLLQFSPFQALIFKIIITNNHSLAMYSTSILRFCNIQDILLIDFSSMIVHNMMST